MLADRFRSGPPFLVGDAAHRVTPAAAPGMNTAIADGYDLGWKLAWVHHGWAERALLDSYEAERRPVVEHNLARSADPDGTSATPPTNCMRISAAGSPRLARGRRRPTSTLDLLAPGFTLFMNGGPSAWDDAVPRTGQYPSPSATSTRSPRAPGHPRSWRTALPTRRRARRSMDERHGRAPHTRRGDGIRGAPRETVRRATTPVSCGTLSAPGMGILLRSSGVVRSPFIALAFERPIGMPNINNEGFAITPDSECVDGSKPVYWADDGETDGHSIRSGTLPCATIAGPPPRWPSSRSPCSRPACSR